jgi:ribosome-associated heat shock protein Hsp15
VAAGHVRLNGTRIAKPAAAVGPGDTLTVPQGSRSRVLRVLAPGTRRGPAPEAQALYEDLTPPDSGAGTDAAASPGARRVGGRPTKKDRRTLDPFLRPRLD